MGDICSRFLGQLSDIWTWLLHKSFQKSFQVPGQKFRVEEKKTARWPCGWESQTGRLGKGSARHVRGPFSLGESRQPSRSMGPPEERSLTKWFKSMDWSLYLCGFASPPHSKCLGIVHTGDSRPHPSLCQAVLNLVLSDWPKALALEILPGLWAWMTCWVFLFNGDYHRRWYVPFK